MGSTGTMSATEHRHGAPEGRAMTRTQTHSYRYVQVSAPAEAGRLRAELVSDNGVTAAAWVDGVDQLMPLAMRWAASDIRWM